MNIFRKIKQFFTRKRIEFTPSFTITLGSITQIFNTPKVHIVKREYLDRLTYRAVLVPNIERSILREMHYEYIYTELSIPRFVGQKFNMSDGEIADILKTKLYKELAARTTVEFTAEIDY